MRRRARRPIEASHSAAPNRSGDGAPASPLRRLGHAPRLVAALRRRGERDDAPPHEEVGLAPAARVEPALVEAERVLLAAEELLRADLGEHAHELRKASRELLE